MALSKAQAGALGNAAAQATLQARKTARIAAYIADPKHCHECGISLSYEKRTAKFCGSSCSAKASNAGRNRHGTITPICLGCGRPVTGSNLNQRKYCTQKCQKAHEFRTITVPRIMLGEVAVRTTLKRYLVITHGHRCVSCMNTTWLDKPIPIEVDHIDGNASNNMPDNLRLLCPNCHADQPTSKGRNRGRGRKSLGIGRE